MEFHRVNQVLSKPPEALGLPAGKRLMVGSYPGDFFDRYDPDVGRESRRYRMIGSDEEYARFPEAFVYGSRYEGVPLDEEPALSLSVSDDGGFHLTPGAGARDFLDEGVLLPDKASILGPDKNRPPVQELAYDAVVGAAVLNPAPDDLKTRRAIGDETILVDLQTGSLNGSAEPGDSVPETGNNLLMAAPDLLPHRRRSPLFQQCGYRAHIRAAVDDGDEVEPSH